MTFFNQALTFKPRALHNSAGFYIDGIEDRPGVPGKSGNFLLLPIQKLLFPGASDSNRNTDGS
jgi:hypothetical protein